MTRSEKKLLIDQLADSFKSSAAVVVCDYKGMTVKQIESLRLLAKEQKLNVKVVKNTLAELSFKEAGLNGLKLKDTNLLVWGEDLVALAKVVYDFADKNSKNFSLKAGHFEGKMVGVDKIEAYSKLASREEFLGMLLSTWTAPIRNLLYVWTGNARELVTALEEIRKQKAA